VAELERVRRRLRSALDLGSIVRAMKALAAVRIRQAREAVASLDEYRDSVDLGLQALLRRRPKAVEIGAPGSDGLLCAVVFGSDLGLAGRLNVRIAELADRHLWKLEPDERRRIVIAVGARVMPELEALGHPVAQCGPAPASVDAISETVQDLLMELGRLRRERGVERVVLFHNHYHAGIECRPHLIHLLPLNPEWLSGLARRRWEGPSLPTFRRSWEEMFSALVQERLFVSIFAAAAESHASEHASRLGSMETAEERIRDRVLELTARYHRGRQDKITDELLDLITGFAALEEAGGADPRRTGVGGGAPSGHDAQPSTKVTLRCTR